MSKLARVVLPGVVHHITQRGVRSMDIFYSEEVGVNEHIFSGVFGFH